MTCALKHCNSCDRDLPRDRFHRDNAKSDSRKTLCKDCVCANARDWRSDNIERARASDRAYTQRYNAFIDDAPIAVAFGELARDLALGAWTEEHEAALRRFRTYAALRLRSGG